MAKYINIVNGIQTRETFIQTTSGAADADKPIATDSGGKLAEAFLPDGIGADIKVAPASEALSAGDLINLFDDSGTLKARKADASGGVAKKADGFVKSAVSSGQNAAVYLSGIITGLTGLTLGVNYYLSGATAGAVVSTAPTTDNYINQLVGKAISATEICFEKHNPIVM